MGEDVGELVGYIKCTLDDIALHLHGQELGDGVWTTEIKQKLVDLGNAKGYYTCASDGPGYDIQRANHGEWLWDVCWLNKQQGRQDNHFMLKRVPFACESEWGDQRAILHDFQKLLCGEIGLGLMIFQGGPQRRDLLCIEAKNIFCNCNNVERKILLARYFNGRFYYTDLLEIEGAAN